MTHKVKVILNPHGGRLTGSAKLNLVEQALQAAQLEYDLVLTDYPSHALELARQAAQAGWPIVVAAGGDGTVNEVSNGLLQAAEEQPAGPLGIIPLGTANDLADMLALPQNITAACQRIAAGKTVLIDVGLVNGRYFVNNSAVGMESAVTMAHDQMRWAKGKWRYVLAAIKTIIQAQAWTMHLDWGSGIFEGPVALVSVGNSPRTGGSFYMTPRAQLDDGLLDFVYAFDMNRWQMLTLLPKTFTGKHVDHPLVAYQKSTSLSITASTPTPIQADGEIIDEDALQINYQIIPKKLRVIV